MGRLADLEAVASALAATGAVDAERARRLVADTADALAVRGATWLEPSAVDLDVRRLYALAAGTPRPRLQGVVAVALGAITSIDLWEDRAEARTVGERLHLDPVGAGDQWLELADEGGGTVTVDLSARRATWRGGRERHVDVAGYLRALELVAVSAARRDPSVEGLNAARRRLAAVGSALGDPSGVARFDAAISEAERPTPSPELVEVVPVACRTPFGWVLSVESWTDHWRALVITERGRGLWIARDDAGAEFGGDVLDGDVVRFDPALSPTWRSVTLSLVGPDGIVVDVDVDRRG